MNKITATLAGLALAAGASVAPAMAQGNLFTPPGTFSFTAAAGAGGVFSALGTGATFNPLTGTPVTGVAFTLTGTRIDSSNIFNLGTLTVTNGTTTLLTEGPGAMSQFTGPFQFAVNSLANGGTAIASVGAATDGTTFNLVQAPVPEASTTASFGLLLALGMGGLVIAAKRKKCAPVR